MKYFCGPEFRAREGTEFIDRLISEQGWTPILGEVMPMDRAWGLSGRVLPSVSMVDTTDTRQRFQDCAVQFEFHGSSPRSIFPDAKVRSVLVVVGDVLSGNPKGVGLVEGDNVVEAFAADRTNPPLCDAVLPRTAYARADELDTR